MATDRFGVPDSVSGLHSEDFYGAIGRVAMLSALIEHQALEVLQVMTHSSQDKYVRLSVSQLVEEARRTPAPVDADGNARILMGYFDDVEAASRRRNDYLHSLWPAQPGGVASTVGVTDGKRRSPPRRSTRVLRRI